MTSSVPSWVDDPLVALVRERPAYPSRPPFPPSEALPEWPGMRPGSEDNPAYRAVRQALRHLGLDSARFGSAEWNPLGELVGPGETVAIKPNFVRHANLGGSGSRDTDCLVTHGSVVRAAIDYAARALAGRGRILVAECPLQGARWTEVVRLVGLDAVLDDARRRFPGVEFAARDYRLTRSRSVAGIMVRRTDDAPPGEYVEVDLGRDSLLVPLMSRPCAFGVSKYPRHRMERSHRPDRNCYLIPRALLEADLFLNLPKLKSHQKAGLTCALKNLVGVNGHKDYLPHFRFGSPATGGDEYPDGGALWELYWRLSHRAWENGAAAPAFRAAASACGQVLRRIFRVPRSAFAQGGGSWHRNDTLWRTILDVNRALLYGHDGGLLERTRRRHLAIADGLVGGDHESPLSPAPVPAGVVLAARNPVALDTVAATLMGFDWRAIPQLAHAWEIARWPLAAFGPDGITVRGCPPFVRLEELAAADAFVPFEASCGWKGWVELARAREAAGPVSGRPRAGGA